MHDRNGMANPCFFVTSSFLSMDSVYFHDQLVVSVDLGELVNKGDKVK